MLQAPNRQEAGWTATRKVNARPKGNADITLSAHPCLAQIGLQNPSQVSTPASCLSKCGPPPSSISVTDQVNQNLRANKILRGLVCPQKGDSPEPSGAWRSAGAADTLRPADSRRPLTQLPLVLSHWGRAGFLAVLLEPGPLIGMTTGQGPRSQTALRRDPGCSPALQRQSSNSAQPREGTEGFLPPGTTRSQ